MNGHEHCIEQKREKNCIFTKHLHMQSISPAHDYYYRHEIGICFSYLDKFKCWTTEELDQRKLKLSNLFRKIPFRLRIILEQYILKINCFEIPEEILFLDFDYSDVHLISSIIAVQYTTGPTLIWSQLNNLRCANFFRLIFNGIARM